MRSVRVIVICLIAAACSAAGPGPRPLEKGFATAGGVADPYADGKRHLAAGRYEVAVERFAQALTSDRRSLDALNGLAIAYTRLGRFDVAQTYFERALQLDATNASTLNNYGWSLIEQGRLQEAKPFLELALRRAEQADVPIVAANLESIGRARPSALVAALGSDSEPEANPGPYRLVRVDDNAYRLDIGAAPAERPEPASPAHDAQSPDGSPRQHDSAVVSPPEPRSRADANSAPPVTGVGRAGLAPGSAAHFRAAEPERDVPVNTPSGGGPIRLWPQPPSASEAGPILPGDER